MVDHTKEWHCEYFCQFCQVKEAGWLPRDVPVMCWSCGEEMHGPMNEIKELSHLIHT